jgi:hypothetical protein
MRLWGGLLFFSLGLAAQDPAPLGIVRGNLVELSPADPYGEIKVETPEHRIYSFSFNDRTYVEREKRRISIDSLRKGDRLEILSDLGATPEIRYARLVHVWDPRVPVRPRLRPWRGTSYVSPTEHIIPRGDLTFSGVILRLNPDVLVLRTRLDGDRQILLRQDTRYLNGGAVVDAGALSANTRVFVRAGRNLDGDIEAYQVIWGGILDPNR